MNWAWLYHISTMFSSTVWALLDFFFCVCVCVNFGLILHVKVLLIRKNCVRFPAFNQILKFLGKHFKYFSHKSRGRGGPTLLIRKKRKMKVMPKFNLLALLTVTVAPAATKSASSVNYILILVQFFLICNFPPYVSQNSYTLASHV